MQKGYLPLQGTGALSLLSCWCCKFLVRICAYVHIIKIEAVLLHSSYLTMVLTEDQLDSLISWYGRTISATKNWPKHPYVDYQYFHDNGLIEIVFDMIGTSTLVKGFILSKKAKDIVKRREPLRLALELMSRIGGSLSVDDMADIVKRIPFAELPELLACDDTYIRELAERKLRKRKFLASMR